ncbi:cyclic nucleotide-binding domain-containing protein [Salinarimonas soli]|uniref:Cyclic nucleotide-binding domain-containing protein n=2 Tax=Salinarimonas soli TaxID=1638099 RepID=A0A5B2VRF4_9HYPH|nr:cyclic nucleotide-binding domain-containing protein [Salinarimonas soli]
MALIAFVLVSVAAVVLETVPWMAEAWPAWFVAAEIGTVAIFTVEYLLRFWCSPEHAPWRNRPEWRARLNFVRQPQAIIDFVAILPFYLALVMDAGDLKSLLILRLFRFLKLARYSPGVQSLLDAIYGERRALVGCGVLLLGTMLVCAAAMHYAEHDAQPDKLGTIPDAMYWAIVTLTTVGYGDVTPITALGRIIASLTAVMGIIMLALPVGIVASAFQKEIHQRDFVVTWSMVAKVPLFAALDASEVAEIMRFLRARSCEKDEIIVRRGEAADAIYFIVTGEVEVRMPEGERRMGPGDFFGEIAVLRGGERTATIVAAADCKLLALGEHDLRHLMDRSPEMARRIKDKARGRLEERGEAPSGEIEKA